MYEIGYLGLAETIKINQLVRNKIRVDAFCEWYNYLDDAKQLTLIWTLWEFACQAHVYDDIWIEALKLTGLSEHLSVSELYKIIMRDGPDWRRLYEFLISTKNEDRYTIFMFSIYIFGLAEGRVYKVCTVQSCNHWWHRDLLKKSVVESILNDPEFYMTSKKDDVTCH